MQGAMVCASHGGRAPQARSAASRREVQRRAEAMVARLDVEPLQDPIAALLRTAAELVALKDWTAQAFAQATADEQWMLAELLGRNLDRCSTLLVRLHGLNLAERRVALEEGMARLLVDVVRGVLVDVGVDPDDREVRRVVRRHFERAGELDEARR